MNTNEQPPPLITNNDKGVVVNEETLGRILVKGERVDEQALSKLLIGFVRLSSGSSVAIQREIDNRANTHHPHTLDTADKVKNEQIESIQEWAQYLASEYNDGRVFDKGFYTYVISGLSVMGAKVQTEEGVSFKEREEGTLAPFPPLNPAALALVYDDFKQGNKESFSSLYTKHLLEQEQKTREKVPYPPKNGKLLVFDNPRDIEELKGLSRVPGGWCTEGTQTARAYTEGEGNTMYVYTGDGEEGRVAYFAIRTKGSRVVEVRGREFGQNVDPRLAVHIENQLKHVKEEYGVSGTEKWTNKAASLNVLVRLEERLTAATSIKERFLSLSPAQQDLVLGIRQLSDVSFGYSGDSLEKALEAYKEELFSLLYKEVPTDKEQKLIAILKSRTVDRVNEVFKPNEQYKFKHVAWRSEDVTSETKIFLGDFVYPKVPKGTDLSRLERIEGCADFGNTENLNLQSLVRIGGWASFRGAENLNLQSLARIGGWANFAEAENLNLQSLAHIEGGAGFYNTENLILSDTFVQEYPEASSAQSKNPTKTKKEIHFAMQRVRLIHTAVRMLLKTQNKDTKEALQGIVEKLEEGAQTERELLKIIVDLYKLQERT